MHIVKWISVEHREEVDVKIQRKVVYLLWAPIEERRKRKSSSTKKQRKDGDLRLNAARITDERAGIEDQKHTSGGVFVTVDSNVGAAVGEKEGAVTSIPGNEGRITQAWVNVRRGMRVFSVYCWAHGRMDLE